MQLFRFALLVALAAGAVFGFIRPVFASQNRIVPGESIGAIRLSAKVVQANHVFGSPAKLDLAYLKQKGEVNGILIDADTTVGRPPAQPYWEMWTLAKGAGLPTARMFLYFSDAAGYGKYIRDNADRYVPDWLAVGNELHGYRYAGPEFDIYAVGKPGDSEPVVGQIRVADPSYTTSQGCRVGSSLKSVLAAFPKARLLNSRFGLGGSRRLYDDRDRGIAFEVAGRGSGPRSSMTCSAIIVHPKGRGVLGEKIPFYFFYMNGELGTSSQMGRLL